MCRVTSRLSIKFPWEQNNHHGYPSPVPKECQPYTNMPKFKATTTTTTKPKMQSCPWLLEKESQIPWVLPVITTVTIYPCVLETALSSSSEDLEFKINKARDQGCRPVAEMLSSIPKAPSFNVKLYKQRMVSPVCNLSSPEAEAGRSQV